MATKAVCVLKSDKVNGVVHFNQEICTTVKKLKPRWIWKWMPYNQLKRLIKS